MKANLKISYKAIIASLILTGMSGLCACGSQGDEIGATYISLESDGTVKSNIEEEFAQSYYDKDELQQSILSQAASYNKTAGENHVTVEKVEVNNNMAMVLMTYKEAADYAAFNEAVFFVGTPGKAQEAGYNLNVVLSEVGDDQKTIGKADILAMEDMKLLITDINEPVQLGGKALYISDHVTVSKNSKVVRLTEGEDGMIYILFK